MTPRILMLEDSAVDAELVLRELRRAGMIFTAKRVETREAFARALAEFSPDIVLSDYKLPGFGGIEALEIVRRDYPEIPLIIVSGALSDQDAAELIGAGARDYVLKDRLARLAPAVARALSVERGVRIRKQAEAQLRQKTLLLENVLNSSTDYIFVKDGELRILLCNEAFARALGKSPEELYGKTDIENGWDAGLVKAYEKYDLAALTGDVVHSTELRNIGGELRHFDSVKVPLKSPDGEVFGLLGISRDITEQKKVEERQHLTAKVFENTLEGISITDKDENVIEVNDAFTRITGYTREEVAGKTLRILKSGLHDRGFYASMWQAINAVGHWRGDIWNRRKDGEIYPETLTIFAITDDQDSVVNYVGIFSDITLLKQHEKQLEHIAHYDALTGIPNRVLLADRLQQAIALAKRDKRLLAVCYLDIDGFKIINDSMGHEAGDQVLIEISQHIKDAVREGDTVARLGGDEFVILLTGLEAQEECGKSLDRLLEAASRPITVKDRQFKLSASIGVSLYPQDDEDPDILMRHADQAMYSAKQSGRNRYYLYDPKHDQRTRTLQEFTSRVRLGLANQEFELYFQPKVDLSTGRPIGAEALIRWRHPGRGLLCPAEFLPSIEGAELDIELGEWVIAAALDQLCAWRGDGLDIELAINISAYHMQSVEFTSRLKRQLDLCKHPGRLQIEILETAALKDFAAATRVIEACRKFGVGFALDDFGTGYSSLSYLSNLPVCALKIDQSFIKNMLVDQGDYAIVQGIIALSRAFSLKTVAEGVETEKCFNVLREMGCEIGQGFFIAHPMPGAEFLIWYRNKVGFCV